MVADTKKVQTLINRAADVMAAVVTAADDMDALKALYQAASPSTAGTPLDGNLAALNQWLADLRTLAGSPVVAVMSAAKVPSHRGGAL